MTTAQTYTQCQFRQGDRVTTCWIESWAAKKGNRVQLLDLDGTFWTITEVYGVMKAEDLQERSRDYKERQGSLKGGGIDE
jgi:hypothetical protein